jgi:hypothetical protein
MNSYLYDLTLRGNEDGTIAGISITRCEDGRYIPGVLNPEDAVPDWLRDVVDRMGDSAELRAKDAEIAALKTEIAPDIATLIPTLRSAGLDAWGARATSTPELMALLIELFTIASEPRSYGQCQRIKDVFGELCKRSGKLPTSEEAKAMQSILDVGAVATGPVAAQYLNFEPWIDN